MNSCDYFVQAVRRDAHLSPASKGLACAGQMGHDPLRVHRPVGFPLHARAEQSQGKQAALGIAHADHV
jgi:hypothetical protein